MVDHTLQRWLREGQGCWVPLCHSTPPPYQLDAKYLPGFLESKWYWGSCDAGLSIRSRLRRTNLSSTRPELLWEWRPSQACAVGRHSATGVQCMPRANETLAGRLSPKGAGLLAYCSWGMPRTGKEGLAVALVGEPTLRLTNAGLDRSGRPAALRQKKLGEWCEPRRPALAESFCRAWSGKYVAFVGDSTQGQMFTSFVHLLGAHWVEDRGPSEACSKERVRGGAHEYVVDAEVCARFGTRLRASFRRNELLSLNRSANAANRAYARLLCDWEEPARTADMLVLNRGAHVDANATPARVAAEIGATLERLNGDRNARGGKPVRLVLRSVHGVREGCRTGLDPLPEPPQGSNQSAHGWHTFAELNRRTRAIAHAQRVDYLDVFSLSAMRTRGYHTRKQVRDDCMHTCLPGPVDDWTSLLFATVRLHAVFGAFDTRVPLPGLVPLVPLRRPLRSRRMGHRVR